MSARRVLQNKQQKDTMGLYLNPDNGYRGKLIRDGGKPKNHMKENYQEIKELQQKMREKKEDDEREVRPLYKLAQFKNVQSKLLDPTTACIAGGVQGHLQEKENRVQPVHGYNEPRRVNNNNEDDYYDDDEDSRGGRGFLQRGQSERRREDLAKERRNIRNEVEMKMEQARRDSAINLNSNSGKAAVPRAGEIASLAPPSNTDFINRNKSLAFQRQNDDEMDVNRNKKSEHPSKHEEFGRVPQYIQERKREKEEVEAERRRRMPDADCPPGMIKMPESERLETLQILQNSQNEAMEQLRRMPFVIETPSMRRKQEMLEAKLREIENAIGIFSKPKVFVAMDR